MYSTVELISIEGNPEGAWDIHSRFLYNFQVGVLLSLKEDGYLTEIQCRNAEIALKKQMQKDGEST